MYILHYWPDSASLIVHIALRALDQPFTLRKIDREAGALSSPAYRALHPLGKIPALETPDGPMFETAAILLWLADRHPQAGFAPAPAAPDRAAFLSWLFFTSSNLHPAVLECFYSDRVAGPAATPELLPRAAGRASEALAALEAAAKSLPALFPTDRPALLPVYVGTLMRWQAQLPDDHPGRLRVADYPALTASVAASEASAAARAVADAEGLGPTIFTNPDR